MATAAIIVGGAVANTLGMIVAGKVGKDQNEMKRHNLAMEKFTKARENWQEQRTERLDFLNKVVRQQNHAAQTFKDLDRAGKAYYEATGNYLSPLREPVLSDYYQKSGSEKDTEIYVILGVMLATGFAVFKFL